MLQKEAEKRRLNPYVWFNNVEILAGEWIGEETVTYIANIYKYYVGYSLLEDQRAQKGKVCSELLQQTPKPQ